MAADKCLETWTNLWTSDSYNEYKDATGRPTSGILDGNTVWFGNYEQCQGLETGKYCLVEGLVNMSLPNEEEATNFAVKWGLCAPSVCSAEVMKENINTFAIEFLRVGDSALSFSSHEVNCAEPVEHGFGFYMTMFMFLTLAIFCCLGTFIDHICEETTSSFQKFVVCWSLTKNMEKLFRLRHSENPSNKRELPNIRCLHGIRVFNICVIMMGHTFLAIFSKGIVANPKTMLEYSESLWWQPVGNAYFMVYSALCLSGVTVSYHGFALLNKTRGIFPKLTYILHRYIRLTLPMGLLLAYWIHIKPHIAEGPLWYGMTSDPQCTAYWWTNLLYINNFYPSSMEQACNGWTWYLSMDFQLHLLAPFVLLTMYRNPKTGLLLSLSLIMGSLFLSALLILYYNIDVDLTKLVVKGDFLAMDKYESLVYGKPYCRLAPYIVGMVTGYMLYMIQSQQKAITLNRREFILPKQRVAMLWVTSLLTMVGCLWFWILVPVLYPVEQQANHQGTHVIYGSLGPLVWAVAIAWVILACTTGHGGVISSLLEWPGWLPLSRLSYAMYLVHPVVMFTVYNSIRTSIYISNVTILMYYSLVLFITVLVSATLVLLVEIPIANLEKVFLPESSEKIESKKSKDS